MKRPTSPTSRRARWRVWLAPAAALIVGLTLFDDALSGFERARFAETLSEGRVDQALDMISVAGDAALLPELAGVNWWPARARTTRLDLLRSDVARAGEPDGAVLVAPAGRYRTAPREARLHPATERELLLQVHLRDLGLQATEIVVPAGTEVVVPELTWLAGTTYDLVLVEPLDEGMRALTQVELLSETMSEDVGVVMATAYDLAPDARGGELLAGLVALHFGLYQEALDRWAPLRSDITYGRVAVELSAIALARMDRDHEAVALLREG